MDGQFYIGSSSNLAARMFDHEVGGTKSTRMRRPFILIHTEHYLSKSDALRREGYFKTSAGKRMLRLMLRESLLGVRKPINSESCP
jgi:putative endonuclease